MAAYQESIIDIDLDGGSLHRSYLSRSLGEGDYYGNIFGFHCFRKGVPEDLSDCSCIGYFIRSDGSTVVCNGHTAGNGAWVDLPQSCYTIDGSFTLAIKVVSNSRAATIRVVDGTVLNLMPNQAIDPGGVVPDLAAIMAVITRIESAADTIGGIQISNQQISETRYRVVVTKT